MSNPSQYHLLRPEARPINHWHRLSQDQRNGIEKLLKMMGEALEKLDQTSACPSPAVPWLAEDRRSQLAFVDGERGTGKSTLMLTLVDLLTGGPLSTKDRSPEPILELAKPLRDRVVILEPLDMEPLPNDTPILAAVLARLAQAATFYSDAQRNVRPRGLFDFNPLDDATDGPFRQFQQRIARGLQSNLEARKGQLDREQFGQMVIEQEFDRLELYRELQGVLETLTTSIQTPASKSKTTGKVKPLLFLCPVDDVDLNPARSLELLRLLRVHSPPQMFFLLMGQLDLVETTARMQMEKPFRALHDAAKGKSSDATNDWEQSLAEVAMANLQKLIPQRISLRPMRLSELLEFRPLLDDMGGAQAKVPTLGELLSRVRFDAETSQLPAGISNLYQLLTGRREQAPSDKPWPEDDRLTLEDYPGIQSFSIPLRRLVDLWSSLLEVVGDEDSSGPPSVAQRKRFLRVFDRHWRRTVEEDPYLSPTARESLKTRGLAACEVVSAPEPAEFQTYRIPDRTLTVASRGDAEFVFVPTLQVTSDSEGDCVPWLRLRGGVGPGSDVYYVRNVATRATFALMHDLRLGLGFPLRKLEMQTRHASIDLVAKAWTTSDTTSGSIVWQLPATHSFVDIARFVRRWQETRKAYELFTHDRPRLLPAVQVDRAVRAWIELGVLFLIRDDDDSRRRKRRPAEPPSWPKLAQWLREYFDRSPTGELSREVQTWWRRALMLTMPEAGEFEIVGDLFRNSENQSFRELVESFAEDFKTRKRKLQKLRELQLKRLLVQDAPEFETLRAELAERVPDAPYFPFRIQRSVSSDEKVATDERVGRMEENLLARMRESEERTQARIQQSQLESQVRQGEALISTNPGLAVVMLTHAAELPQVDRESSLYVEATLTRARALAFLGAALLRNELSELAAKRSHEAVQLLDELGRERFADVQVQRQVANGHTLLGKSLEQLGFPAQAANHFGSAMLVRERLASLRPDDREALRAVSISHDDVGRVRLAFGDVAAARMNFEAALEIDSRLLRQTPDDRQALRDVSVTQGRLGDVRLKTGDVVAARNHFEAALEINKRLLNQSPDDRQAMRDVSVMHTKLGDVRLEQDEVAAAREHFEAAFAIQERLLSQMPDSRQALRDVSVTQARLGDVRLKQDDLSAAREHFEAANVTQQRLVNQSPNDRQALRDLSIARSKLGDIRLKQDDVSAAQEHFEAAFAIAQKLLSQTPDDRDALRDLSVTRLKLGDVRLKEDDVATAREHFEAAFAIAQKLLSQTPDDRDALRDVSVTQACLGDVRLKQDEVVAAREHFESAFVIQRQLLAQGPNDRRAMRDVSLTEERLGDVRLKQGDMEAAREHFEAALAIRQRLLKQTPDERQALRDVSVALGNLGDVRLEQGDVAAARENFEAALAIQHRLLNQHADDRLTLREVGLTQDRLGHAWRKAGEFARAREHLEAAISVWQRMLSSTPDGRQTLRDLSTTQLRLGDVRLSQGDLAPARKLFESVLAILQRLLAQTPTFRPVLRDKGLALKGLGDVGLKEGNLARARKYFLESLAIAEQLVSEGAENRDYQVDLATVTFGLSRTYPARSGERRRLEDRARAIVAQQREKGIPLSRRMVELDAELNEKRARPSKREAASESPRKNEKKPAARRLEKKPTRRKK